jgi:putative peptide zinc metalloprotease protein
MTSSAPSLSLHRRKQVRVRLRSDLSIEPQKYEGRTYYVVKDPVSLRYYRFKDREHFLMRFMDGRHTLENAQQEFEKHFRPQRLKLEEIEGFAQLLMTAGLAHNDSPETGKSLFEQRLRHRRHNALRSLTDVLAIRIPLIDPDPLLERLHQRLKWLLSTWFLLASTGVILAALLLVMMHFDDFRHRLPSFREFFTLRTMVSLWLVLGAVKVLHELGHGLCCKAFGGEVHEMGILFLCLSPCLYCDVSDAWVLPGKWQRILIGFAGIHVELLIAALATFVWWNTPGQPFLNHLCLSLMVVCSINTVVFNANPLLRYDGYYVLADWLEVPNLRERANRLLNNLALKHGLGIEGIPEPYMARGRRRLLVVYAVASHAYRWAVMSGVMWFLFSFLKPYKLEALGGLLVTAATASMVGWPLCRFVDRLRQRGRLPRMKAPRVLASAGVLGMAVLCIWVVPLPIGQVRQTALVQLQPDAVERIFVPAPAVLERLYVRDGQAVQANDLLAEFRSRELENQLEEARSEHDIRVVQIHCLRDQIDGTAEAKEKARLEVLMAAAAAERDLFARQGEVFDLLLKRLVLRAPRAGVVMSPPRPDEVGRLWHPEEETPFCIIADTSRLRALMPVTPADYRLLNEELSERAELPASIRLGGTTGHGWKAKVTRLPEAEAREVPLPLTLRGGGPLAVEPSTRPDVFVPQSQQYLVAVDFQGTRATVFPGTLAEVRVHCRWRPGAWCLWRMLASTFDLGPI